MMLVRITVLSALLALGCSEKKPEINPKDFEWGVTLAKAAGDVSAGIGKVKAEALSKELGALGLQCTEVEASGWSQFSCEVDGGFISFKSDFDGLLASVSAGSKNADVCAGMASVSSAAGANPPCLLSM